MPKAIQAGDFFVVGGPVQPDRACYIERSADGELLSSIAEQRFCYVLSPRATGKSSLMARTIRRLRRDGQLAAVIDLTQIGARGDSTEAGRWYYSIAYRIVRELRLKVDLQSWWQEKSALLGDQRLAEFFWEIVLTNTTAPVTIFFDEAERVIDLSFSDELFSAIRSCYVQRVTEPDYMRLNFVVLGVATPAQLCRNASISPFVDGQAIELEDFTLAECYQLGAGFGVDPTVSRGLIDRIYAWTNGHPYLTQKIARGVARRGSRLADVERVVQEQFLGPGSSQEEPLLNHIRALLAERAPKTRHALGGLIRIAAGTDSKKELPPAAREQLQLSGIVTADAAGALHFRNQIFARVFDERWAKSEMPVNWRLYAAVAAGIAAALWLPYWYTQILPRPYINTLSVVTQDYAVAEAAYERLRRWPGFGATADRLLADVMVRRSERTTTITEALAADAAIRQLPGTEDLAAEMMGKFWMRQAAAAMHRGDRDVALVYATAARSEAPDVGTAEAAELIGTDYAHLQQTFRLAQAPISWDVDWGRNELVVVDPAHRVERLPLQIGEATARGAVAGGSAAERLTAIQHVPVTRELHIDEDGNAGAFNLLLTVDHPRASDIMLTLTAPSGEAAMLPVPQPRVDQHDLIFDARGNSPLARLSGEAKLGRWQLTLVDRRSGDAGVLSNWGLQFGADREPWQDAPEQGVPLPDPVRTEQVEITLSRAGRLAVAQPTRSGASGTLAVWDLRSGALVNDLPIARVADAVAVSAETNRVLAVTGDELTVWDVARETPVATRGTETGFVLPPVLSGDETFFAIAEAVEGSPPVFSLLRTETGETVRSFEGVEGVEQWVLGPQASFLAVLDGSRRARIFDPRSGTPLAELRHHQDFVRLIATADENVLVSVDVDGAVHAWQIGASGDADVVNESRLIGATVDAASVSLSSAGDGVAFALADGFVAAKDLPGARRAQHFRAESEYSAALVRIGPRAEQLVTASGPLFRLWRLEPSPPSASTAAELSAVALDRGGEVAAFGFRGGHVRVRRLSEFGAAARGDDVDYIGHRGMVTSLAVNAARNIAASGGSDGVVRVWNLATVAPSPHFLRHPVGPIRALSISADGSRIVSAAEYSARVWQAQTGELISEVPVDGAALAVAFSEDANLVVVSDTAGNIFFGAPDVSGPLLSARAPAAVTALAVSPDSTRIVSGDDAGDLQLWDVSTGDTALATYLFQDPVSWAAFGADGSAVYARSGAWVHELRLNPTGLAVVASRLVPIAVGPDASPAALGDDSIRWLAGAAVGELAYADVSMHAPAAPSPADAVQLARDWQQILGLELDRATGAVRIPR